MGGHFPSRKRKRDSSTDLSGLLGGCNKIMNQGETRLCEHDCLYHCRTRGRKG